MRGVVLLVVLSSVSVPPVDDQIPIASAYVGMYAWQGTATFRSITVIDRAP